MVVGGPGAVVVVAAVEVDYRTASHVTAAESVQEGLWTGLRPESEGVVHEGQGRIAAGPEKGGGIAARWGSFWLRQRTFGAPGL